MSISHKYIDKSIFSRGVLDLANFFFKLSAYDNLPYTCKDSEEEEMMDYFCSIGCAEKSEDGKYLLEEDCSIMNSFRLFLNCLTNKFSMPYTGYCSEALYTEMSLLELRLSLQVGFLHGDFVFGNVKEYPYLICVFNEEKLGNEPMCLHPDSVDTDVEDIDEVFSQIADIKSSGSEYITDNCYFIWDRKRRVFVFESKEEKDVFEKTCSFYREYPKEYKENTEIGQFMNNPTEEGANKIIESLKADFQSMYPDADVTVRIMPMEDAKVEPLKPVEPENITKMEKDNKKEFTCLLDRKDVAHIFKNGEFYCTIPKSINEGIDCFLVKVRDFIDKMNS